MPYRIFRQENGFSLNLPENIREIALNLSQFIVIYDRLKLIAESNPERATLRLELDDIHAKLLNQSATLLDSDSVPAVSLKKIPLIIGQALRFMLSLEGAIGISQECVDTYGSECLKHYRTELKKDFKSRQALMQKVKTLLGLSFDELEHLRQTEQKLLEGASRKQSIVKTICRMFAIEKDNPQLQKSTEELFQYIYGDVPLPPNDLKIIVSGTMIFFCLPFDEKTRLYQQQKLSSLPAQQQDKIAAFMKRLAGFKQQQFAHFPVFGFIRGDAMHPDFLESLTNELPYSTELVRRELDSIFTVLPHDAVDKYLFHDVVGHSWQASMLSFEDFYTRMASYHTGFEQETLSDGKNLYDFILMASEQEDFSERLTAWLLQCFEQRLAVSMAPVVAEILADIAEYRFIDLYPQLADKMPSSSLFKWSPTKLDFLVEDVRFYFSQAGKSFRLWLERPERSQLMADELQRLGLTDSKTQQIIDQVRTSLENLRTSVWDHQYLYQDEGKAGPIINLPFKMALNFLSLHVVISKVYGDLKGLPQARNGIMHGFVELMLLSIGLYFESDPKSALWTLDEFAQIHFVEMIKKLFAEA